MKPKRQYRYNNQNKPFFEFEITALYLHSKKSRKTLLYTMAAASVSNSKKDDKFIIHGIPPFLNTLEIPPEIP